jgi:hypothetical protein
LDSGADAAGIAKDTGVPVSEVQQWLANQTLRVPKLDSFAIEKLGIKYRDAGSQAQHSAHDPPSSSNAAAPESFAKKFAFALGAFDHGVPKRGHPFPPLPKGWSCNLSTSHGLYYFRPPTGGEAVYRHPNSGKEYYASPQAFALHNKLSAEKIAGESHCSAEAAENWLLDQSSRNSAIDSFVLKVLGIRYRQQDARREHSSSRNRKRSR